MACSEDNLSFIGLFNPCNLYHKTTSLQDNIPLYSYWLAVHVHMSNVRDNWPEVQIVNKCIFIIENANVSPTGFFTVKSSFACNQVMSLVWICAFLSLFCPYDIPPINTTELLIWICLFNLNLRIWNLIVFHLVPFFLKSFIYFPKKKVIFQAWQKCLFRHCYAVRFLWSYLKEYY